MYSLFAFFSLLLCLFLGYVFLRVEQCGLADAEKPDCTGNAWHPLANVLIFVVKCYNISYFITFLFVVVKNL